MNVVLLETLLGKDREWSGPCTVVLDADAAVKTAGPDHIHGGGVKTYAPRYASGRLEVDSCCLVKEHNVLCLIRQETHKDSTGAEMLRQTLTIADIDHVVALEFAHIGPLKKLGLPIPFIPDDAEYRPGMLVG